MPFAGFDDWDDCMDTMLNEEGHDEQSAQNICGALQAEAKSDSGNVEQLRQALEDGAGLVADVGVDLVSGVNEPAVNSKWTMLKSEDDGHDYRVNAPLLLSKADGDDEKRISYAAAMIPRQPDKEGDVVPTPTVEKAAHEFVKGDGGIDTDHSLIDGEGEPVESWVLKEERTFDLPGGGSETYPAGTWMLGVEWGADAWSRIKSGDLTGLSIYGMAEHVPLERAAKCACKSDTTSKQDPCWDGYTMIGTKVDENGNEVPNCVPDEDVPEATMQEGVPLSQANETSGEVTASKDDSGATLTTDKADSGDMGSETTDGDTDDAGGDSPNVGELAASVDELNDTVESMKEAVETEKADAEDAAEMLATEMDLGAGDVLDILRAAEGMDVQAVVESIREMEASADEDGDTVEASGDDGETADTETAEKDAGEGEANLEKGHTGEGARQSQIEAKSEGGEARSGMPSYAAAAEQREGGN
ncbi:head maturation protease [Haloarcula sinaiiensis tailed virus 1]|uniref:Head maturation protease n=1 Tax=Haloarcula sinaiiensis tailed virus 1 TaxID=1262530 RepID=R9QT36_9CAUD|nr:head maturation protease [Haloarcula sinaiiensis tailed virus 1]AGC34558.1 head maturation protease [Haloarcula sinaiiensis tailed virus 1]